MPFRKDLDPYTRWVLAGGSGKKKDWWKVLAECAEVAQETKRTTLEILLVVIETLEYRRELEGLPPAQM